MRPTVSVAIATYNRERMVRQAIESALAQTLPPLEVCVSDDASTDGSWETLQAVARNDPRVRVYRQRENSGGVENWNFAIAQTSGDYIAWCSDDDRFLPGHLEASTAYLEAHPEVGFVHSGFIDAVETGVISQTVPRELRFASDTVLTRDSLLRYLIRYYDWPFHPSTIVMRREAWINIGRFHSAYALADTEWFIRAVERYPAAMLARHGVLNRRHPDNWSNRLGSARMQREIFTIVNGAIDRRYGRSSLRRTIWKTLWRWNARLRLLLTIRARMQSGHGEAAGAAWMQLLEGTKMPLPRFIADRIGAAIRAWSARTAAFRNSRESVSPL